MFAMASKWKQYLSALFASGALLFSSFTMPATAATIAGTKCTKVGSTKIASNLKHTCVKSGSKLVWNKGVAIKPATKLSPTPIPTPTPEAPYSNYTEIERDVYLEMDKIVTSWSMYLSAGANKSVKVVSEDPANARNEENRISVEISVALLKDMQPRMITPDYYTYTSSAWVDKEMESECPRLVGQNRTGQFAGAQVGCGKLITANLGGWMNAVANIDGSWFEAAHETFHIAQVVSGAYGTTLENSKWYPNTPAWFREGSASTFGALVRSLMSKGRFNYGELNSFEKSPTSYAACKKAWDTWQTSNSATNQFDLGQCEYGLGRRMTDYLVAKHGGVSAILKNYELVAQNQSFDEAFKTAHGITLAAFFVEIKPFLAAQGFRIP